MSDDPVQTLCDRTWTAHFAAKNWDRAEDRKTAFMARCTARAMAESESSLDQQCFVKKEAAAQECLAEAAKA
ncbi:MAG: hypothetical protein HY543_12510, partial [Deltaproteobacteria bacterium]|nr:hypothetical protein [Deltaproteobacteria bacterium]